MMTSITVKNQSGDWKAGQEGAKQTVLAWEGEYQEGDQIIFRVSEIPQFYVVRADSGMDEALVYLAEPELIFDIPFGEKKASYNPNLFTGTRHYLTLRKAEMWEVSTYRNLAKNVLDQHGSRGCFPHAWANVETRGESVFAARNAIDGVLANRSHGKWPYQSWGINRQDDANLTLEFGRPVDFDQIVLYTRADFPHDNWWVSAAFVFSDGSTCTCSMEKQEGPHVFQIEKQGITWIRLEQLIKADDPSPFPALTQIEVYGRNA